VGKEFFLRRQHGRGERGVERGMGFKALRQQVASSIAHDATAHGALRAGATVGDRWA
jgi:hypothetical protein